MCIWKHIVHVEKSAKCEIYNFKNIVHSCKISSVYIAPVQVQNWAKYEGSELHYVVRRAT